MKSGRIDDAAAAWVARLDAGDLSPAAAAALEQWLQQDVRHAGAFARARAVDLLAHRASALGPGYDADRFGRRAVRPPRWRQRVLRVGLPVAASILVAVALGYGSLGNLHPRDSRDYATAMGEVRRLPLDDGSTMTLNTASLAQVDFTADLRLVRLEEGEALFDVAKDPSRPFLVDAEDVRVRAVGTSFTVRRLSGGRTEVLVREGLVRIEYPHERPGAPAAYLGANMRAIASGGRALALDQVAQDRLEQRLTWRDGMIAFHGETLAEAAEEFARYSETRLLVEDPAVAGMRVVGLYAANDPDGFARAVALSFGLEARRTAGAIRLQAPAGH